MEILDISKNTAFKIFVLVLVILGIIFAIFISAAISGNMHDQELKKLNEKGLEDSQRQPPQEQIEIIDDQVIVNDYGDSRRGEPTKAFNSYQLVAIENALSKGITIQDDQNDWETTPDTLPEGEVDNENPYPLPWTDLKSVSFGADENYIYFKFQFWGNFPREPVTYEGDLIQGVGTYVAQLRFGQGKHDWAQLQDTISYMDAANTSEIATAPQLHHSAMISPTGERDEKLDDIYEQNSREGMIGGGADTDYLLAAYPLELLGLKYGDTTTFNLGSESHSTKYHHVAKDHILSLQNPDTKHGGTISGTIRWIIGSNTYENVGALEYKIDGGRGYFPGIDVVNSLPDCTESEIFSYRPIAEDSYTNIMPLGHLNPPSHTIPTDHIYLVLNRDGSKSAVTDVFSPGEITIYEIKKAQFFDNNGNVMDEDYGVYFSPCKQIRAWYGHIIISDAIKTELDKYECMEMGSPPGTKQCNYIINYKVKVGEYMGITGGGNSACLDLGVYDSRSNLNGFANRDRYSNEYLQTKCPIDYFTDELKTKMAERFGWENERRTVEPICGNLMQDVPGTIQGVWFDGPISNLNLENEGKVISVVHDNMLGIKGKLVIGGQISEPGVIEFNPTHSGTKNREPNEVKSDEKIYCYQNDNLENKYMPLLGKVILQLVDVNTLKIEYQDGNCNDNENFVEPYIYTR